MHLSSCTSTKEKWDKVTKEYQAKSTFAQANLKQAFLDMRCPKGGDVQEFLANLCYKKEELATTGVTISNKEYKHTILCGIPSELATFASNIVSSALIIQGTKSIDLNTLINQIGEEVDQIKGCHMQGQGGQGGKKEGFTDEALAATNSEGGRKKCHLGSCHNCGKKGHWTRECHSSKKKEENATTQTMSPSTTSKQENKPVGAANAMSAYDSEGDSFWMVEDVDIAEHVSAEPDLMLDAEDNFDVVPDWEGEEDTEDLFPSEEWAGAAITPVSNDEDNQTHIELYDSGVTCHISPYKSDFISYTPLSPPVFLNAANKQKFPATGSGTLIVQIPYGDSESKLTLHGALHAPSVNYTLVSLAMLDEEGYHAHIGTGYLDLVSPQGE